MLNKYMIKYWLTALWVILAVGIFNFERWLAGISNVILLCWCVGWDVGHIRKQQDEAFDAIAANQHIIAHYIQEGDSR